MVAIGGSANSCYLVGRRVCFSEYYTACGRAGMESCQRLESICLHHSKTHEYTVLLGCLDSANPDLGTILQPIIYRRQHSRRLLPRKSQSFSMASAPHFLLACRFSVSIDPSGAGGL